MKYILLAIALLFNMCVQAQETTKAKAYSAESFYELDSERLADKDVKELADNDVDEIKRIIREVRWLNKTSKPLGAGVFVEFKPKEGFYLGYNGFAVIDSLGLIIQSYSYPKKSRSIEGQKDYAAILVLQKLALPVFRWRHTYMLFEVLA